MNKEIKISGIVALIVYAIVILSNLGEYGLSIFLKVWTIEYALVIYIAVLLTLNYWGEK